MRSSTSASSRGSKVLSTSPVAGFLVSMAMAPSSVVEPPQMVYPRTAGTVAERGGRRNGDRPVVRRPPPTAPRRARVARPPGDAPPGGGRARGHRAAGGHHRPRGAAAAGGRPAGGGLGAAGGLAPGAHLRGLRRVGQRR